MKQPGNQIITLKVDGKVNSTYASLLRAQAAIDRVRLLHSDPFVITHELDPDAQRYCRACSIWHDCEEWGQTTGKSALVKVEWPCPTLRALDGEQA